MNIAFDPFDSRAIPSSQPLITCPTPKAKSIGAFLALNKYLGVV